MSKVLIALTGARVWSQKNGTQRPTGFWAEEFAVPHEVLSSAGEDITVATPGGVVPVPDQFSLSAEANNGDAEKAERFRAYLEKVQHLLDTPQRLEDIDPGAFDVVLVPGGHGPMQDLAVNADIARIHAAMLPDQSKIVAALCHGPASFLSVGDENGNWLFRGRKLTAFTNEEEHQVGLDATAPWLLEDRLRAAGANFTSGSAWQPYVVVDGNLITAQNPASAGGIAHAIQEKLR